MQQSTVFHSESSASVYSSGRRWDAGRIFISLAAAGDEVGGATAGQATPTAGRSAYIVSLDFIKLLKYSNDMQI
jgi:hypothetical protein